MEYTMTVANTTSTIINANTMPMPPHTIPTSPPHQQHMSPPPLPIPHTHPPCNPNAGHALISTYELLEQILISLPATSLLISQRVNKQFASVIATSPRLQQKLFFTPKRSKEAAKMDFKALLNPILTREEVRLAIPLFFDPDSNRLARYWKDGFMRLFCHSITATTVFVYLEFSDEEPSPLSSHYSPAGSSIAVPECDDRLEGLKSGSWEDMYLAQPSCFFIWKVRLTGGKTLSGIVKGERTMGKLLEGLGEEVLVER